MKTNENMFYTYGMRLRPFDIGCQPMDGLVNIEDGKTINGKYYWNFLTYNRELSNDEVSSFDLEKMNN